ncbi:hypothetical protein FB451DRAFT_1476348 [Mycena latifolia]|nr:hypothetical protein FB451DRAFT_1476348 [Mycena latifolia]
MVHGETTGVYCIEYAYTVNFNRPQRCPSGSVIVMRMLQFSWAERRMQQPLVGELGMVRHNEDIASPPRRARHTNGEAEYQRKATAKRETKTRNTSTGKEDWYTENLARGPVGAEDTQGIGNRSSGAQRTRERRPVAVGAHEHAVVRGESNTMFCAFGAVAIPTSIGAAAGRLIATNTPARWCTGSSHSLQCVHKGAINWWARCIGGDAWFESKLRHKHQGTQLFCFYPGQYDSGPSRTGFFQLLALKEHGFSEAHSAETPPAAKVAHDAADCWRDVIGATGSQDDLIHSEPADEDAPLPGSARTLQGSSAALVARKFYMRKTQGKRGRGDWGARVRPSARRLCGGLYALQVSYFAPRLGGCQRRQCQGWWRGGCDDDENKMRDARTAPHCVSLRFVSDLEWRRRAQYSPPALRLLPVPTLCGCGVCPPCLPSAIESVLIESLCSNGGSITATARGRCGHAEAERALGHDYARQGGEDGQRDRAHAVRHAARPVRPFFPFRFVRFNAGLADTRARELTSAAHEPPPARADDDARAPESVCGEPQTQPVFVPGWVVLELTSSAGHDVCVWREGEAGERVRSEQVVRRARVAEAEAKTPATPVLIAAVRAEEEGARGKAEARGLGIAFLWSDT